VNPRGTDVATTGSWERGTGELTKTWRGVKQRDTTPSGQAALFTGRLAGVGANANDVDGGVTSIRSPVIELGESGDDGWKLTFSYSFAHDARARSVDYLRVSIDGASTPVFIQRGAARNRNAAWRSVTLDLDAFAGQSVRLLIEARDAGADSLVEAAIDDVRVYKAE
jgi:aminopeptidase S